MHCFGFFFLLFTVLFQFCVKCIYSPKPYFHRCVSWHRQCVLISVLKSLPSGTGGQSDRLTDWLQWCVVCYLTVCSTGCVCVQGMLEPTKEPVKPISAAEMIASIAQMPAVAPEMSSTTADPGQVEPTAHSPQPRGLTTQSWQDTIIMG